MSDNKYKLGTLAIIMLVALRLTLGWHFFYEGVWKINQENFTVKPLLTAAKGPFSPLFHGMIPDLDGQERLALTEMEVLDDKGKPVLDDEDEPVTQPVCKVYLDAWTEVKDEFVSSYASNDKAKEVDTLFTRYEESLKEYCEMNEEDIIAYLGALDRLQARTASGDNEAKHEKKRLHDAKMKLRAEGAGFLSELDAMGAEFSLALWNVQEDADTAGGKPLKVVTAPEKLPIEIPCCDTQVEFLSIVISYSLAAIGLCLLLGFCTRPALIGGGLFLITVLMNQPPWPSIYPPAPPQVGHALIVDKNFVEMMAMFALATLPVGRWAGLDFFCHHWCGRKICGFFSKKV